MAATGLSVEMSGDESRLLRSVQATINKFGKLEGQMQGAVNKAKSVEKSVRRIGSGGRKELGPQGGLASDIKGTIARIGGIAAAAGLAKVALSDMAATRTAAGERITTAEEGRSQLAQLADTKPQFEELIRQVEQIRTERGIDEIEAFKLVFSAASAGFKKQTPFFAELKEIGFAPEAAVTAVQKLSQTFPDSGTPREIINKTIAAAAPSPVGASDIARVAAVPAVSFKEIGGTADELLALVGVLAKVFKNENTAAEKIKTLADQVGKKREFIDPAALLKLEKIFNLPKIEGLELLRQLPGLAKAGALSTTADGPPVTLREFLSEQNAVVALKAIQAAAPEIRDQVQAIQTAGRQTGTPEDQLAKKFSFVREDPKLSANRRSAIAKEKRELAEEEDLAVANKLADAFVDERLTRVRERGSELGVTIEKGVLFLTRKFSLTDRGFLERQLFRPDKLPQIEGPFGARGRRRNRGILKELEEDIFDLLGPLEVERLSRESGRPVPAEIIDQLPGQFRIVQELAELQEESKAGLKFTRTRGDFARLEEALVEGRLEDVLPALDLLRTRSALKDLHPNSFSPAVSPLFDPQLVEALDELRPQVEKLVETAATKPPVEAVVSPQSTVVGPPVAVTAEREPNESVPAEVVAAPLERGALGPPELLGLPGRPAPKPEEDVLQGRRPTELFKQEAVPKGRGSADETSRAEAPSAAEAPGTQAVEQIFGAIRDMLSEMRGFFKREVKGSEPQPMLEAAADMSRAAAELSDVAVLLNSSEPTVLRGPNDNEDFP